LPAFSVNSRSNAYRVFLELEAESLAADTGGKADK
jgi:hypothetical protein